MPDGNYTDIGSTPFYFAWLTEKLNFTYVELKILSFFFCFLNIGIPRRFFLNYVENGRISYDYLPNQITKSQYGNLGDIALVLKVVEDKVKHNYLLKFCFVGNE